MSETDDIISLGRLQSHYADVVNRRAWAELDALFLHDCPIRLDLVSRPAIDMVGADQLGRFIGDAVQRFSFFEFVTLNSRIELSTTDPDGAAARIFMCEIRRDLGSNDWSTAYGVYHDRYRRTSDGWRFARRDYQSLTRTDGPVFDFPHEFGLD